MALIDGGKVVYAGGFGVRALGRPERVDENTVFMAASNTKGMTTLLLSELVDEAWDLAMAWSGTSRDGCRQEVRLAAKSI